MDGTKKIILTVVSVSAVAVSLPLAVLAMTNVNLQQSDGWNGRWSGWGDWEACAEIASVKPREAIDSAIEAMELSPTDLWYKTIELGPVYVSAVGDVYNLDCSGGVSVGSLRQSLQHPTVSHESYAWEVDIYDRYSLCMPGVAFIEWEIAEPLYHVNGC